jgi:two-component system sensor histidine kinase QseC
MRPLASLQGRLLALVLGLLGAVWAVTAVVTWLDTRHELDELLDSHLTQAAALLVAQQAHDMGDDGVRTDAPSLHKYAPKVAFQVFHEGQLSLRSANAPTLPMVASTAQGLSGFTTTVIDGTAWRVFGARGAEQDVQVMVGEQVDSRNAILWAVLRTTLWPLLLAIPVIALGVWWAVHRGTRPLRLLGQALATRPPDALQPVVLPDAPAEMAPMLVALNGLLARIAALMASERRFTADAAHELRTPIAAIRAQAEVALRESDGALRQHALDLTLQGCDRAARLVTQLLTLSRLETGEAPALSSVNLGAFARTVAAELAPQALARQQTISLDTPDDAVVSGNDMLLQVLLRNLLDNATRYSPARATVQLIIHRAEEQVLLSVADSGLGLHDAHMLRLGERFFRPTGTSSHGSGLGLSIVRRIAEVHRATVQVGRSAALGGLEVTVRFTSPAGV